MRSGGCPRCARHSENTCSAAQPRPQSLANPAGCASATQRRSGSGPRCAGSARGATPPGPSSSRSTRAESSGHASWPGSWALTSPPPWTWGPSTSWPRSSPSWASTWGAARPAPPPHIPSSTDCGGFQASSLPKILTTSCAMARCNFKAVWAYQHLTKRQLHCNGQKLSSVEMGR